MSENAEGSASAAQQNQREILQEAFFKLINIQNRRNKKLGRLILEQTGLTFPQMVVLMELDEHGGTSTMQTLAQHLQQTGGAMTNLVDRLFNAGLVSRETVPQDRRIVQVVLTEKGKAKIAAVHAHFMDEYKRICAALSNEELAQFMATIRKLAIETDSAIQRLSEAHHKNT